MKTTTEVRIGGEGFTVTSEEGEQELVLALAHQVDQMMEAFAARPSASAVSPLRVAIMAALALADQLRTARMAAPEPPPEEHGYR